MTGPEGVGQTQRALNACPGSEALLCAGEEVRHVDGHLRLVPVLMVGMSEAWTCLCFKRCWCFLCVSLDKCIFKIPLTVKWSYL